MRISDYDFMGTVCHVSLATFQRQKYPIPYDITTEAFSKKLKNMLYVVSQG